MTVKYSYKDGVGQVTIDDSKVNALSIESFKFLNDALDQAESDATITIITGREGIFSAGFDLKQLGESPETAVELLRCGADLCSRLLTFPVPVIAACTGHAYPMGAFILLSTDYRIGIAGAFNIGMNEVRINMAVPKFAVEVARGRLLPAYFNRTAVTGEVFSPEEAVTAGFLDEIVEPADLASRALSRAQDFRAINKQCHHTTKLYARSGWVAAINEGAREELTIENARKIFGR